VAEQAWRSRRGGAAGGDRPVPPARRGDADWPYTRIAASGGTPTHIFAVQHACRGTHDHLAFTDVSASGRKDQLVCSAKHCSEAWAAKAQEQPETGTQHSERVRRDAAVRLIREVIDIGGGAPRPRRAAQTVQTRVECIWDSFTLLD